MDVDATHPTTPPQHQVQTPESPPKLDKRRYPTSRVDPTPPIGEPANGSLSHDDCDEHTFMEEMEAEYEEFSRLAARAAHNAVSYSRFNVGETVNVIARTWTGINKPGGVALVTRVHVDGHSTTYDVRYVLGGIERGIDEDFLSTVIEEGRSARTSRAARQPKSRGGKSPVAECMLQEVVVF